MCGLEYCLRCNMIYHVAKTCEEVQKEKAEAALRAKADDINNKDLKEDAQLREWAKKVGAKQCGKCRYWVVKNHGCDHMTCRCGYEFCYVCGGKYRNCDCRRRR